MVRIKFNNFFILFLLVSFYTGYIEQSIIIFISVLLHEIGHAAVAKCLKIKVEEIELFPFGGVAKMEDITKYGGYTEAYIALVGPLISGFIAVAAALIPAAGDWAKRIAQYNFILFSFNILPALPLDGGRVLRNILLQHLSYKQATKTMVMLGRAVAVALISYNAVLIYEGSNSIAYIITGIFIYLGCLKELKFCSYYYLFHKNNYKNRRTGKAPIKIRTIKLHKNTYVRYAANQFSPGSICVIHAVDNKGNVTAVLSEADIMDAFLKHGYDCRLEHIKSIDRRKLHIN